MTGSCFSCLLTRSWSKLSLPSERKSTLRHDTDDRVHSRVEYTKASCSESKAEASQTRTKDVSPRLDADPLEAAIRDMIVSEPCGRYLDCIAGLGNRVRSMLTQLSDSGHLKVFFQDPSAWRIAKNIEAVDSRLEVFFQPPNYLAKVKRELVRGVVLDMGSLPLVTAPYDGAVTDERNASLRACPQQQVDNSVSAWLYSVSSAELAWVIDKYGIFSDPLLCERVAEGILRWQREHGRIRSTSDLSDVLEEFRPDFEFECPWVRATWLFRGVHVFLSRVVEQIREALEATFERLQTGGRCIVRCVNKWELEVVRRFIHDHEEPSAGERAVLCSDRFGCLYPLVSTEKQFAVQVVGKPVQGERREVVHVLEKTFRQVTAQTLEQSSTVKALLVTPPVPAFGTACFGMEQRESTGPEKAEEMSSAQRQEIERLTHCIVERKAQLKDEGLSLSQQKKDPYVLSFVSRVNNLYNRGARYREVVEARCRNRTHVPVLLLEAVDAVMALGPDRLYVDCTFGRGGHTKHILSRLSQDGRLKSFDVDPLAVQVGQGLAAVDRRFEMIQRPFGELSFAVQESIAGVLLDIGVSTPQLEDVCRGFNYKKKKDGPLDMRMDQNVGVPASAWLQTVSVEELAWVIYTCGHSLDTVLSQRIAAGILHRQHEHGPYTSTHQLATTLDDILPRFSLEYPNLCLQQIVFAAIRIFLNREMEQLDSVLDGAFDRLEMNGRCVIVTFNTWEPICVKRFVRDHEEPSAQLLNSLSTGRMVELYPLLGSSKDYAVRRVAAPSRPSSQEVSNNGRSRSALLHVLEKVPRRTPRTFAALRPSHHAVKPPRGSITAQKRLREPPPHPRCA
eukprot:TRINITY_DN33046_c0_g1_i1.p1 TRINITY_DN33046_c0_g1~~TRINITY_DN33046_c0_g1_i1.p1  ORF type:complete len:846 (-),score=87.25 TRINITY_DN33046_c0_g1_i1:178-2715(-)